MRVRLVFDAHARRSKMRSFPILSQHQRDRLSAELDLVVVERSVGRPFLRRDIVLVGPVGIRHRWSILVCKHIEHAADPERFAGIDAQDTAFGDGRLDNIGIDEVRGAELSGIFGRAGDLGPTVDAGYRGADVGACRNVHRILLLDWDCGVARAAWVSARMTARRARSILNVLWPYPLAPCSSRSAAREKLA